MRFWKQWNWALAEAVVQDEMQQLKEQEQQLNAEVAKLKQAQRHLQEAEEETEKLETQYKAAQQKEQEIHVALEGNRAVLKQRRGNRVIRPEKLHRQS